MSKILCVIDGMIDPAFDIEKYLILASFPKRGHIKTVPDGFEAETLPCVLSLLGITPPPRNIRGWIEALGAGIPVSSDDLVFRGSWVLLNDHGVCIGFCDAPDNIPELERAQYASLNGYKGLLLIPGYASYVGSMETTLQEQRQDEADEAGAVDGQQSYHRAGQDIQTDLRRYML